MAAVITAVPTRSGRIDLAVAPVKLLASLLTLATGGSVGKERCSLSLKVRIGVF